MLAMKALLIGSRRADEAMGCPRWWRKNLATPWLQGSGRASPGPASGPPLGAARHRRAAGAAPRRAGRLARWQTGCGSRRSLARRSSREQADLPQYSQGGRLSPESTEMPKNLSECVPRHRLRNQKILRLRRPGRLTPPAALRQGVFVGFPRVRHVQAQVAELLAQGPPGGAPPDGRP